jgi:RNA polymerase sigma factor (sigma-70 family)
MLDAGRAGDGSSVVQDASVVARERFGQFRGQTPGEFFRWLAAIVRRTIQGRYRKAVRCEALAEAVPIDANGSSPSSTAARRELAARLREVMTRLSERDRLLIDLRNFEDWSYKAIAQHLGTTEDAARQAWFRAFQKLRREWEGPDGRAASR